MKSLVERDAAVRVRCDQANDMSSDEEAAVCREVDAIGTAVDQLERSRALRKRAPRLVILRRRTAMSRAPRRKYHRRRHSRAARRPSRGVTRKAESDSGGSDGGDGPGEAAEGSLVRRCSLRPHQPKGPPGTGNEPAVGYNAELAFEYQPRASLTDGSREVGVKSRNNEGTSVPWCRHRRKRGREATSSLLDTEGITRQPRQSCDWRSP
jgi:hypothetical protein